MTVEVECPAEAVEAGDELLVGDEWCRVRRVSHVERAERVVIVYHSKLTDKTHENIFDEGAIVRVRSFG